MSNAETTASSELLDRPAAATAANVLRVLPQPIAGDGEIDRALSELGRAGGGAERAWSGS